MSSITYADISTREGQKIVRECIDSEVPIIISNMKETRFQDLTLSQIKNKYKRKENEEYGWYTSSNYKEYCPQFLKDILTSGQHFISDKPMRVFCHPKGHNSLLHYDGNSIHGFNLQVRGRKEWTIVSPDSSMPLIPFMYVALIKDRDVKKEIDSKKLLSYTFILNESEMLFVPRYWLHKVKSLEEVNISLNWVLTPKLPSNSRVGQREAEILKLRKVLPIVNKAYFPDDVNKYGGGSSDIVENYTQDVTFYNLINRFFKEVTTYLKLPYYYKELRKSSDDFSINNFNVKEDSLP